LGGLGGAPADQAHRVRDFAIGKDVKVGEMARLFYVDRDTSAGRTAMWNWFVKHYDQVVARTGTFASGRLPGMAGGGGCSQAEAERMTQFFTPRLKELSRADTQMTQHHDIAFSVAPATAAIAGSTARFPVRRIFCIGRNYAEHAAEM